jgi:hypothetical protein
MANVFELLNQLDITNPRNLARASVETVQGAQEIKNLLDQGKEREAYARFEELPLQTQMLLYATPVVGETLSGIGAVEYSQRAAETEGLSRLGNIAMATLEGSGTAPIVGTAAASTAASLKALKRGLASLPDKSVLTLKSLEVLNDPKINPNQRIKTGDIENFFKQRGVKDEEIRVIQMSGFKDRENVGESIALGELENLIRRNLVVTNPYLATSPNKYQTYASGGGKDYYEKVYRNPLARGYDDTHYGKSVYANMGASIKNVDGKKILSAERIQSQLHGRAKGSYQDQKLVDEFNAKYADEVNQIKEKNIEMDAVLAKSDELSDKLDAGLPVAEYKKTWHERNTYNEKFYSLTKERDAIIKRVREETKDKELRFIPDSGGFIFQSKSDIPKGPFPKNYEEMMIKDMIDNAIKKNLDGISTPEALDVMRREATRGGKNIEFAITRLYDEKIPRYLKKIANKYGGNYRIGKGVTSINKYDLEFVPTYHDIDNVFEVAPKVGDEVIDEVSINVRNFNIALPSSAEDSMYNFSLNIKNILDNTESLAVSGTSQLDDVVENIRFERPKYKERTEYILEFTPEMIKKLKEEGLPAFKAGGFVDKPLYQRDF